MRVRTATREDAAAVADLITTLARKFITKDFSPEAEAKFLSSCDEGSIAANMDGGFRYLVALNGSHLIGVVGMRDGAHLFHLFIAEASQGLGIGRDLWHRAMTSLTDSGYRGDFTVNSSHNAVGFYEKLGFVRAGEDDVRGGVVAVPMCLSPTRT